MQKRIVSLFLAFFMAVTMITGVSAKTNDWYEFRTNDNIIDAKLPVAKESTKLDWVHSFLDGKFYVTYSNPIIGNECIYIAVDSELYKLDKDGNVLQKTALNSAIAFNAYLAYGNGMVFVALGDGTIQAFDSQSLTSLWLSQVEGNLTSPLTYYNGYLYTGTTEYDDNYNIIGGQYFALSVSDEDPNANLETKQNSWDYHTQAGGYYWSDATIINNQYLVFVSTGGTLVAKDITSENLNTITLDSNISIRSGVCYGDGHLYIGSQSGKVYKVAFNNDGTFGQVDSTVIFNGNGQITGTPTYVNGTLYFGGKNGSAFNAPGFIAKMDVNTLQLESIEVTGNVQSSFLVTTGYDDGVYGYYTINSEPGGLYVFKDTGSKFTTDILYEPEDDYQNYNMGSAISDGNKLYFTNDSGALFALENSEQPTDNNPTPTPPAQTTDTDTSSTPDQVVNSVKTGDDQSLVSMLTLIISGAVLVVLKKD